MPSLAQPRFAQLAVACAAIAVWASSRPAAAATPAAPPASISDSLLALVPLRSQDRIREDLDEVKARAAVAETDLETARRLQALARTAIEAKRAQRDSLQANVDVAKREKDVIAEGEWKAKKRLAELEKGLLEQREALRESEIAVAAAHRDHARAEASALESELELAIKREQRGLFAGRGAAVEVAAGLQRMDGEIEALERRALEAQLDSARRRQNVARAAADLARRRLGVLAAQSKLLRGR